MKNAWFRVAMLLVFALTLGRPALADDKIVVKVGASADKAQEAKASDISVDALQAAAKAKGKTTFTVTGAKGKKHTVELSAKEAASILAGTTVTADAAGGGPKLWIALVKETKQAAPAADSGW